MPEVIGEDFQRFQVIDPPTSAEVDTSLRHRPSPAELFLAPEGGGNAFVARIAIDGVRKTVFTGHLEDEPYSTVTITTLTGNLAHEPARVSMIRPAL